MIIKKGMMVKVVSGAHKGLEGKVLFVRDSGVVFSNMTSIEINDRLTGRFGNELKGENRQTALMNLINEQVKDGNVSADDFYNFVNGEPNNNRFLNHLESYCILFFLLIYKQADHS